MAPRSVAGGTQRSGIGQRRGCFNRAQSTVGGASILLRRCIFLLLRTVWSHYSRCRLSFRASCLAKPPSRQRRLIRRFSLTCSPPLARRRKAHFWLRCMYA
jgi:hypothetical protein